MGVLNDGRNSTHSSSACPGDKIFAARVSGILKVHVAVDHSWQDKQIGGIAVLMSIEPLVSNRYDYTVLNVNVCAASAIPANNRATLNTEIIGHRIL
jgi:hypothetical protein